MRKSLLTLLLTTLLILPGVFAPLPGAQAQTADCITDFDADTDYFPDKATFTHSENVTVEYFNHYKLVSVRDAFDDADLFSYALVHCGAPTPAADELPENAQVIEVPVNRFIALATTQLPHLVELERLDVLVGLAEFTFVNTPAVRDMIDAGELVAVGSGAEINVETTLDAEPDVVMAFGFNPATDAHPVLLQAGVPTVLNASWREATPLGRAEWIKYTSLFLNEEAAATERFAEIETAYEDARTLAASISADERPSVLWNRFSPFTDAWSIPGAETYAAALVRDAGGALVLGERAPGDSEPFSFEVVYEAGLDADIWIVNAFGVQTADDLLATDPRYADFAALQSGNAWNNNLDVNENGGNNYFEFGVTNPHLILRDLVALFHPELLPDHEFIFYRNLTSESSS